MYRHLLVPIDGTPVSANNVEAAVELAKTLRARITFFHATPDWDATSDGALMRVLDPKAHDEALLGDTNALLAKAVACAAASDVPAQGAARVCDRPAEAILEAAKTQGCDLIVMASRGSEGAWSGWLHSSQTERVLRRAPVALLVTRVASAHPLAASERAISLIQDEHRSLAVVAKSLQEMAPRATAGDAGDLAALGHLVRYLQEFPERVHHPKEERYLHRLLRERHPSATALLAEVEAQHVREHRLLEQVTQCLAEFVDAGGAADTAAAPAARLLNDAVKDLSDQVISHIGFEEREVLPLARAHLAEADWREVAEAFAANDDARFGDLPAEEFRRLFTRIANAVAERPAATAGR
jgi:nucleotide-binding universal stress UspA family protein/hemerythrin-like domain-containing protein